MISILSYTATILSLAGNYMVAKKMKVAFPVWILSNILWILINYLDHWNTAQVIMYLVFAGMNVYGWINWKKD